MKVKTRDFGNELVGRIFLPDVNFCLAAIAKISQCTTDKVEKDVVIDVANIFQMDSISMETPDGVVWDDIFSELRDEGLIETQISTVCLTPTAIEAIDKKFPDGIF